MSIEILCAIPHCNILQLRSSPMASMRLRLALCAEVAEKNKIKIKFTDGSITSPVAASIIFVGKIDVVSDTERINRWCRYLDSMSKNGSRIVIDYTDNHLDVQTLATSFYQYALPLADTILCSSERLAADIRGKYQARVIVIEDPVEIPLQNPKTSEKAVPTALWFGHGSNLKYLIEYLEEDYPRDFKLRLILMSNLPSLPINYATLLNDKSFDSLEVNVLPWGLNDMISVAKIADFCLLPAGLNDLRKVGASSNRLLTAFALGLPVAADILPSYEKYKQFFLDIRGNESIELFTDPGKFHSNVIAMQKIILEKYTAEVMSDKWLNLLEFELGVLKMIRQSI
jgi:hypothetical protein